MTLWLFRFFLFAALLMSSACGLMLELDEGLGEDTGVPPAACTADRECGDCAVCEGGACYSAVGRACVRGCATGTYACEGGRPQCDANEIAPAGMVCREADGECDVEETCDGTGRSCPSNVYADPGVMCADGAGTCAEDGTCLTSECIEGRPCNDGLDLCEIGETRCTDSGAECVFQRLRFMGATCRPSRGECDLEETCDGVTPSCPPDALAPTGEICRDGDPASCDAAEVCNGGDACPDDAPAVPGTPCGDLRWCDEEGDCGPCQAGDPCVVPETCEQGEYVCEDDAQVCVGLGTPVTDGRRCRGPAGVCDVPEVCDGTSIACPEDRLADASVVCRPDTNPDPATCDIEDHCTGVSPHCSSDAVQAGGTVCRASAGVCDRAEVCDGSSGTCPADARVTNGTICRAAAGACDVPESCDGASPTCPGDTLSASGTLCRPGDAVCDPEENCTGSSPSCPANMFTAAGTPCSGGSCNGAGMCALGCTQGAPCARANACELGRWDCGGGVPTCVSAGPAPPGTVCRVPAGACDLEEVCNGTSLLCPADALAPSSTVCRAAAGTCDLAERCTGTGPACPANAFRQSGYVCRPAPEPCDVAEVCSGTSVACPPQALANPSRLCRPTAGDCDTAEYCDNSSAACPPDGYLPSGTQCGDPPTFCDPGRVCSGTAPGCSMQLVRPAAGTRCSDCGLACNSLGVCAPIGGAISCDSDEICCPYDPMGGGGDCALTAVGCPAGIGP